MSSAFWSASGILFLRVGTALQNDCAPECFLFVFSPNPKMHRLHWEEEWREQGGLYGETSFCRYMVQFQYRSVYNKRQQTIRDR